jgi:hypothetical protein
MLKRPKWREGRDFGGCSPPARERMVHRESQPGCRRAQNFRRMCGRYITPDEAAMCVGDDSTKRAAAPAYSRANWFEPIKLRRVLDEDGMTKSGVRRPSRELVQYAVVVDRQWRPQVGGASPGPGLRIGMGPIASPEDALRIGCDERLRERRDVSVVGPQRRDSIGRRELHVCAACREQTHQRGEAGLANT